MKTKLLWLGILAGVVVCETAAGQPNILVYLSDDHSQFDSSLYGSEHIPTPNFEKLAAGGMVFTHAFVVRPPAPRVARPC
jgi:arylsulfatase A-like enzyme